MNNQFILNNEPRKHCHLENLGSILLLESLVWLHHSDAEGRHPFRGTQPARWQVKDHPGQLLGLWFLIWLQGSGRPYEVSNFTSSARQMGVALWSLDTFKIPIYWFLLLCASSSLTNLLMARIYKVLMGRGPSNFSWHGSKNCLGDYAFKMGPATWSIYQRSVSTGKYLRKRNSHNTPL